MKDCMGESRATTQQTRDEFGQSIVLIAVMFVALVAAVGLAVDAGFLFTRSAQFTSAVDAATLAGVVELHEGGLPAAITRAEQFLNANGWPVDETASYTGSVNYSDFGLPQFTFTATWPIETFFIRIVGIDQVEVTRSASAAYYAQTDMPTPTFLDRSRARTAGLYVFGPEACTGWGDPVTPPLANPSEPNPIYFQNDGDYLYRIRVSDDYLDQYGETLRVQLFDPDNANVEPGNTHTITHSDGTTESRTCAASQGNGDSCFIDTNEDASLNPVWLVRVDETYTGANCATPDPTNQNGNTVTRFELFYYLTNNDRVDLAAYQSGATSPTYTDLKWVTPGVTADVPTDYGTFDVNVSDITPDGAGNRALYLKVSAVTGASKNGFDLWAGPPDIADTLAQDVNDRNLQILNNGELANIQSVEVFAVGKLPLNHYRTGTVRLPVASIDTREGGGSIYASIFDLDNGAAGPVVFTFNTITPAQYSASRGAFCSGSPNCNNQWVTPHMELPIPTRDTNPGLTFFGGYLMAEYTVGTPGAVGDEHTWYVAVTNGRPFLTR